jgi:site-specific DNA recombinase
MTRVALYARYSSDNQSVASIDDQFRICREHAAREKWNVVGTYHDAAISGASVILRPGVQAMLQDAQRGAFDTVLAEALDRVSRDQADVATLFKHLRFAGVQIVTLSEGEISELHVGLKGTMNALFLKDLAAKTHRGIRGRVEKGKSGGGLCYGYNVVRHTNDEGEPIRGERTINPTEAEIIRRVFRAFGAGISPRAIARPPQQRKGSRPRWRAVDRLHLTRPRRARHRPHQQRALRRQAGLEPPALRQGPDDGQSRLAPQSAREVDHDRGSRIAHRR